MIIENRKVIDISDAPYFSSYFKNTAHIVLNDEDLNEWTDRIKNILLLYLYILIYRYNIMIYI